MPSYHYVAKDTVGKILSGEMEAPDERTVAAALREHQLFILKISQRQAAHKLLALGALDRVKENDVLNFTRQFSIMVSSGLSVTQALTILRSQATRKSLQAFYDSIYRDIQSGNSLSKAIEKYPKVFSPSYIALVRAGEASGLIEQIFTRLAETLEKQKEFRSKTKGALIYPVIVLFGMVGVMLIMMIFVIPKLATLYSNLGTSLPLPTKILIGVSNVVSKFWWLVIGGMAAAGTGYFYWKKTPIGAQMVDAFSFRMPIFGSLRRANVLTELTRTLGLLTTSGVPIVDALHITAKTTGSVLYESDVNMAATNVEKGLPLAESLDNKDRFPQIVSFMIRTGEETGKLGDVLLKLAHFYEIETEQKIKNLTVAMEPIIMIVLGVGVGFLILSIILPIYKITNSF